MKAVLTLLIILFITHTSSAQSRRHEIGINFAKIPYSNTVVWNESESFLQVFSPITYKYFISDKTALRANMLYQTNEINYQCCNSYTRQDASWFSLGIGFQRFFGTKKFKPNLYSDLSFVSEDFYRSALFEGIVDYTSSGFSLSGGAGLRYELTPKWAFAYEADLSLYIRKVDGYSTKTNEKSTWSNAILTNLTANPISNLSINYRF